MGRQRRSEDAFTRWRKGWNRRLASKHGKRFADEVMGALDDDVEAFGVGGPNTRALREAILPALVANTRRGGGGGAG